MGSFRLAPDRGVKVIVVAPPKALLFDWDHTLVDNWRAIHIALNATLAAMGHKVWTLGETKARVRESLRDSFPRMFGEQWTDARDIFYRKFQAHHLNTLQPMPGASEGLRELRKSGRYMGVVSNKLGDDLRMEVTHLGWQGNFDRVIGATDAAHDKPAKDPVILALAEGGPPAGPAVWFIGDTGIDMACAHEAGCTPILVGPADPASAEFNEVPPARHVADFTGLVALVRAVEKTIS